MYAGLLLNFKADRSCFLSYLTSFYYSTNRYLLDFIIIIFFLKDQDKYWRQCVNTIDMGGSKYLEAIILKS
jgi:hypothetical protein